MGAPRTPVSPVFQTSSSPSQDHSPRHLPETSSFLLPAFAWVRILLFAWLVPSQPWSTYSSLLPRKASPNSLLEGLLLLLFSEALVSFRAATQCENIFLLLHWNCLLTSSFQTRGWLTAFSKWNVWNLKQINVGSGWGRKQPSAEPQKNKALLKTLHSPFRQKLKLGWAPTYNPSDNWWWHWQKLGCLTTCRGLHIFIPNPQNYPVRWRLLNM